MRLFLSVMAGLVFTAVRFSKSGCDVVRTCNHQYRLGFFGGLGVRGPLDGALKAKPDSRGLGPAIDAFDFAPN
jgi:hypothetical protein